MKSCKSVHESAALVIGRRGLGHHERLPKELMDAIKTKVKRQLIAVLGSMEESCKQSKSGKKQRQSIAIVLRKWRMSSMNMNGHYGTCCTNSAG
jgi:hypothetical protein